MNPAASCRVYSGSFVFRWVSRLPVLFFIGCSFFGQTENRTGLFETDSEKRYEIMQKGCGTVLKKLKDSAESGVDEIKTVQCRDGKGTMRNTGSVYNNSAVFLPERTAVIYQWREFRRTVPKEERFKSSWGCLEKQ